MHMTGWLEYFTEGLKNQLAEVKLKGEKAIMGEVLFRQFIRDLSRLPETRELVSAA